MKIQTSVLFLLLFISLISYAQTPISEYNSAPMSNYAIVTVASAIDESISGANVTWTFDQLIPVSTSTDSYAAPTTAQLISYPGTTAVLTIDGALDAMAMGQIFTKDASSTVSITGVKTPELDLNYATDNALIGTFPLSYGYTNTDTVEGTYDYFVASNVYSGTFSGTAIVSVDGYGTLNLNDVGNGAYSGSVTRLKTVQNITLSYSVFPEAGTVTQTVYYYYDATTGDLVFRSSTTSVLVPVLNVSETIIGLESLLNGVLDVQEHQLVADQFMDITNPVEDMLQIQVQDSQFVTSITISDMSGKQLIVTEGNSQSIAVDHLENGFYIVTFTTIRGDFTKKIFKI